MYFLIIILLAFFNSEFSLNDQNEKLNHFTKWRFTLEGQQILLSKSTKVKIRKSYSAYNLKDEKLPSNKPLVEEIVFDREGNIKEKKYYDMYGSVRDKYIYAYDKKNNLIKTELVNAYGNIISKKEYKYNSNNDTTEIKVTDRNIKNSYIINFAYDSSFRLNEKIRYNYGDVIYIKEKYLYNNSSLKTIEYYDTKGEKVGQIDFSYNEFGNLIKEKKGNSQKIYLYDESNRRIKSVDGNYVDLYKYDNKERLIDHQFFIDNNRRQFRLAFDYYKNGLLREIIRYDSEDKKAFYTKYVYQYYK